MKQRNDPNLPLYVSVAGYDIAWVHLRLDNIPKYYRFKEYKQNWTSADWKCTLANGKIVEDKKLYLEFKFKIEKNKPITCDFKTDTESSVGTFDSTRVSFKRNNDTLSYK